jgi:hypothetical protein
MLLLGLIGFAHRARLVVPKLGLSHPEFRRDLCRHLGQKSFRNFAEICVRLRIVAIGVFLSDFRRPLAHRDKPSGESDDVGLTRLRIASISDA